MRFPLILACVVVLATPVAGRAEQVERSSMDVPQWWSDVHVCWPEDAAVGAGKVLVGVEGKGSPDHPMFVFRAARWGTPLPEYVRRAGRQATSTAPGVLELAPSGLVGFADDWFDLFVLPDRTRLTCMAVTEE